MQVRLIDDGPISLLNREGAGLTDDVPISLLNRDGAGLTDDDPFSFLNREGAGPSGRYQPEELHERSGGDTAGAGLGHGL